MGKIKEDDSTAMKKKLIAEHLDILNLDSTDTELVQRFYDLYSNNSVYELLKPVIAHKQSIGAYISIASIMRYGLTFHYARKLGYELGIYVSV